MISDASPRPPAIAAIGEAASSPATSPAASTMTVRNPPETGAFRSYIIIPAASFPPQHSCRSILAEMQFPRLHARRRMRGPQRRLIQDLVSNIGPERRASRKYAIAGIRLARYAVQVICLKLECLSPRFVASMRQDRIISPDIARSPTNRARESVREIAFADASV